MARKKVAKKKAAAKKKSVTRAAIGLGERAGQAIRRRVGKAIKPGTGFLAKSRAEVIESNVRKATGRKKK